MPVSESSVVSLGNWIGAFPVVYTVAAIAVVAASAVVIEWGIGMLRRGRMSSKAKLIWAQVAGSNA
jgi:hypothetical protein